MRPLKTLHDRSIDVWSGRVGAVEQIDEYVVRWVNAQNMDQCVYFRMSRSGVVQVQIGEGANLFAETGQALGWDREPWARLT
ncbi:MAG TPA: hypothetical protein DD856_01465, partial [Sulfobacillus sp.]|nr:hypothetical protein [Sulfobacillus sp.]